MVELSCRSVEVCVHSILLLMFQPPFGISCVEPVEILWYDLLVPHSDQHLGEGYSWQKYLSAPVWILNVRLTPRTTTRGVHPASRKTLRKSAYPSASTGLSTRRWTAIRTTLSRGSQGSWRRGEGNSGAVRYLTGRTPFFKG